MPEKSEAQQQGSHLLSLPPELRNRIFELVLPSPPDGVLTLTARSPAKGIQLPILSQVSRQVRRETLSLFFSNATLRLHTDGRSSLAFVRTWLDLLRPHLDFVRHVEFKDIFACLHDNYYTLERTGTEYTLGK